jgi:hypothetical protein
MCEFEQIIELVNLTTGDISNSAGAMAMPDAIGQRGPWLKTYLPMAHTIEASS